MDDTMPGTDGRRSGRRGLRRRGVLALVLALALAATAACTGPARSPLAGTSWVVTGMSVGTDGIVPASTPITADFGARGTLSGRSCNTYSARWTADGEALTITGARYTSTYPCPPPMGPADLSRYLEVLGQVRSWRIDDDRLVLLDAAGLELVTADAVAVVVGRP
jgi:heat shock protein HslJ